MGTLRMKAAGILTTAAVAAGWISLPLTAHAAATSPAKGAWFGAYVNENKSGTSAGRENQVTTLESEIGRKLDIDHHYHTWGDQIAGTLETWDIQNSRIPMISWRAPLVTTITSGSQDAYILSQAEQVAALHTEVLLRWGWEMDNGSNQSWAVSSAAYIAAWQHIHNLFVTAGATNAQWVWCPQAIGFSGKNLAASYYPGDGYVDWIGADGYNWAPGVAGQPWRSFDWIFTSFYNWSAAKAKPLLVGETGVQEDLAGQKAQWFADARTTMETVMPAIRAFVYFDAMPQSYNWQVTSSLTGLAAYTAMGADTYFRQPH